MEYLKKLFVPYELAVKLKEKGFNEPCIGLYLESGRLWSLDNTGGDFSGITNENKKRETAAPLYQQITDWFRDKYNLHFFIVPYGDGKHWSLCNVGKTTRTDFFERINSATRIKYEGVKFNTYYEALDSAIEEALKLI